MTTKPTKLERFAHGLFYWVGVAGIVAVVAAGLYVIAKRVPWAALGL